MKDLFKVMFPLNIQIFAEPGKDDEENKGGDTGDKGQGGGDKDKNPEDEKPEGKTFTQGDVDALIAKEKAKQKAKYEKLLKDEDSNPEDKAPLEDDKAIPNPFIEKYAVAEIKATMATFGIDPTKIDRAVRLVDYTPLMSEEGELDKEKLTSALTELLKSWPELKAPIGNDNKGFKIGSDRDEKEKDVKSNKAKYREAIEAKIAQDRKK